MTPARALEVIEAARGVRYKTKALREALKAYDDAEKARVEKADRDRACVHPRASRVAFSSVGHYDPNADRYWWERHCPDCDKQWTEDQ